MGVREWGGGWEGWGGWGGEGGCGWGGEGGGLVYTNPEGLMCLQYLSCDLSLTLSSSITHHIHKASSTSTVTYPTESHTHFRRISQRYNSHTAYILPRLISTVYCRVCTAP